MLDFVPPFLARVSHNLHPFLDQYLELLGPLLHLHFKPRHTRHSKKIKLLEKETEICFARKTKKLGMGKLKLGVPYKVLEKQKRNHFKPIGLVGSNALNFVSLI